MISSSLRPGNDRRFTSQYLAFADFQASNKLSGEILETLEAQGKEKFELGPGGWGAFVAAIPESPASDESPAVAALGPRVALFGQKATETRTAVENYIRREQGLRQFLKDHAGWKIV